MPEFILEPIGRRPCHSGRGAQQGFVTVWYARRVDRNKYLPTVKPVKVRNPKTAANIQQTFVRWIEGKAKVYT